MDQAASLDVSALLLAHSGLSLLASVSVAPVYNLPLALYGLVVVRSGGADDGGDGVRQFALLFGSSFLLDLLCVSFSFRPGHRGRGLPWPVQVADERMASGHRRARTAAHPGQPGAQGVTYLVCPACNTAS